MRGCDNEPEVELFESYLDEAMKIAACFTNIPHALLSELRQEARLALANAAVKFDSTDREGFKPYARKAINNRLRSLYRQKSTEEKHIAFRIEDLTFGEALESFDEPSSDTPYFNPRRAASLSEARDVLRAVISELPEDHQMVMRAFERGEIDLDIAATLGVSKQSIGQLKTRLYDRLRRKLGERGINESAVLLSRGGTSTRRQSPLTSILEDLQIADLVDAILPGSGREK